VGRRVWGAHSADSVQWRDFPARPVGGGLQAELPVVRRGHCYGICSPLTSFRAALCMAARRYAIVQGCYMGVRGHEERTKRPLAWRPTAVRKHTGGGGVPLTAGHEALQGSCVRFVAGTPHEPVTPQGPLEKGGHSR
jgi:hypothetical protein